MGAKTLLTISIYKLVYKFLLIIQTTLHINNFLVYKIVSNLVNIVTNFFFLKLFFSS